MSSEPISRRRHRPSRWFMPAFSVALGVIMLAALWIGGHPGSGLGALGVMTAFGGVLLLVGAARRSAASAGTGATSALR